MKNLWNQNNEARAFIVSAILTIIGLGGTMILFWFRRYDIPLAVLLGGAVVTITWFSLYLVTKTNKPRAKTDIALIFTRLFIVTSLAFLFAILSYQYHIVIVSPIYLVISYLVVSILTVVVYVKKKGARNV